jgi:adenosine deaminase
MAIQQMPDIARPLTLDERFALMPKAEIHVHLEGATDAETSYLIARRNAAPLPVDTLEEWRHYFQFRDFPHFINVYRATVDTLRTVDDLALMIAQFYVYQARQNIRYTECFISMSLHLRRMSESDVLDALAQGIERGTTATDARVAFIADISREDVETQSAVLDLALRGAKRGLIVGLGLGGLEAPFPPRLFRETYRRAADAGLQVVAHAGEGAGHESVREAVEELGVSRIGHGIRVIESAETVATMRERNVAFEVCPVSNYALGTADSSKPHPIRAMLDAGLRCTVNSDDPAMFSTDLAAQYALLAQQGFSWDELWALNVATLEATFLGEAEKAAYRREWEAFRASLA